MTDTAQRIETRRRIVAAAILAAGLVSSLVIYLTATPAPPNPLGYEPEDSKQYLRQMEVYGGKSNVLASEIRQWLESLWHGRRLATTVICLTFLFLLFYWIGSTPLPDEAASSSHGDQTPDDRPGP